MADRFWVGGSGTWNTTSTTNWSATSGGGGGASVPTAADNVYFDGNSAAGTYSVSTSTGLNLNCLDLSIVKPTAGTVTFTDTGVFNIAGSVTVVGTGVTWSAFGAWILTSSVARTVNVSGITLNAVTFNGAGGGSWQLLTDLNLKTNAGLTLTAGTINLNNFNLVCGLFSSNNSNVRSLQFGTGVVNLTGAGVIWAASSNTNFTMTGNRVINAITATTTGIREIQVGTWTAATAPSVNVIAGTSRINITGSYLNINTTGYTGQLDAGLRTIYGNLTLGAGSTIQITANATVFAPTGITAVLTTNGVVLNFPMTLNGPGGTLQLADNLTTGIYGVALLEGTLDLNGRVLNAYSISGTGSLTRSLVTTGATINLFGNSTIVWSIQSTNFTLTPNTVVNLTYAGASGSRTVVANAFSEATAPSFVIQAGSDTIDISGSVKNITFVAFSGIFAINSRTIYGNLTLSPTMTVASVGASTTTFAATSGVQTITTNGRAVALSMTINAPGATVRLADNLDCSTGAITARSLTLTAGTLDLNDQTLSIVSFSSSNTNTRQIAFGSTGVMNVTLRNGILWQMPNVTNFSYTGEGRVNLTAATGTTYGTRTVTHANSVGGSPTTKPPSFYVSGGDGVGDILLVSSTSYLNSLVFTDSGTQLANTGKIMYGDLILSSGMTVAGGVNVTTFAGDGYSQTIDTGDILLDFPITIGANRIAPLTGVTATDLALTGNNATIGATRTTTLFSGTLTTEGLNLSTGFFVSNNTNVRALNIVASIITISGSGGQWNITPTNLTLTSGGSTIDFTSTTTTTRTFTGGGLTYYNLNVGGATGTSILNITGNNTFTGAISSTKTVAHTIQFAAGSTNTINSWTVNGSSGNLVTVTSATAAAHNLVKSGAGTVNVQYTSISYSNASPTNKWYALIVNNNVDAGNNTGWIFVAPPSSSSNFFLLF